VKIQVWAPEFARFGGGIGNFSRELARAFRSFDHDISLNGFLDRPGTWEGLTLSGAGYLPRITAKPAFAALLLSGCARKRPDLIVSSHINFGPIARLAKSLFGIRYMLVAHGVDVNDRMSSLNLQALRNADRIIAVSAWTRDRLLALGGIHADRIALLPNTVDTTKFRVRGFPESLRKRYRLSMDERVLLTVARLGPTSALGGYKGCDRVLEALPAIAADAGPIRYVIVGEGPDRARLEGIARDLDVEAMVTFAGFVPEDELPDHYRLADVFAMPSTGEGFGIVFLESMASGTPVVAGNADGSVDALNKGELGRLADPNDVQAIAAAVTELLRGIGPSLWFERNALHDAVELRFGRAAFRERVAEILSS